MPPFAMSGWYFSRKTANLLYLHNYKTQNTKLHIQVLVMCPTITSGVIMEAQVNLSTIYPTLKMPFQIHGHRGTPPPPLLQFDQPRSLVVSWRSFGCLSEQYLTMLSRGYSRKTDFGGFQKGILLLNNMTTMSSSIKVSTGSLSPTYGLSHIVVVQVCDHYWWCSTSTKLDFGKKWVFLNGPPRPTPRLFIPVGGMGHTGGT